MPRGLPRTGKPRGRPPGTAEVIPRQPTWLTDQENFQLLIHWLGLNVPRRLILEYCKEAEIMVPGEVLGKQLQSLANFSAYHRQQIVQAHDEIRALAVEDAQKKREDFLEKLYDVRDWLYEHMRTDRDASGRTHMVRDFIHLNKSIADIEGFQKGTFDPRQQKAVEELTKYMFGDKDAETAVDAEITVLSSRQLPPGQ